MSEIKPRILLLDNYDSFTYNLQDYFLQLGVDCVVFRNDEITVNQILELNLQAIVFSPGPKRPNDAGIMMDLLAACYRHLPILGICLGHQAIGEYFGARLIRSEVPVHGKTSRIVCGKHPIFNDLPDEVEVMRYHSLILESLDGTPLRSIAHSQSGEIMALEHPDFPLVGLQFHPESILTKFGIIMLENWLNHFVVRKYYLTGKIAI